jgi:hypothetical protein
MPATKKWIITTSPDHSIEKIKKELVKAGFSVENVFDQIGSLSGTASDEVIEKLKSVDGVADVSPDHPINIGPPDAPVTW